MIRKALYPEYYVSLAPNGNGTDRNKDHLLGHIHTDHCVDSIRQTLMCGADISSIVWVRDSDNIIRPEGRVAHSCRNFDRIAEWIGNHEFEGVMDESQFDGSKLQEKIAPRN